MLAQICTAHDMSFGFIMHHDRHTSFLVIHSTVSPVKSESRNMLLRLERYAWPGCMSFIHLQLSIMGCLALQVIVVILYIPTMQRDLLAFLYQYCCAKALQAHHYQWLWHAGIPKARLVQTPSLSFPSMCHLLKQLFIFSPVKGRDPQGTPTVHFPLGCMLANAMGLLAVVALLFTLVQQMLAVHAQDAVAICSGLPQMRRRMTGSILYMTYLLYMVYCLGSLNTRLRQICATMACLSFGFLVYTLWVITDINAIKTKPNGCLLSHYYIHGPDVPLVLLMSRKRFLTACRRGIFEVCHLATAVDMVFDEEVAGIDQG